MTGEHYLETATAPAYDLVLAVRRRRLRYLGHVLRMPTDRMVRCALILLFLIYINDIKTCTNKLSILSYADDTTVYLSGPNTNEMIDIMNTELKKLYDWLCANRLSLNKKENVLLHFQIKNTPAIKSYL